MAVACEGETVSHGNVVDVPTWLIVRGNACDVVRSRMGPARNAVNNVHLLLPLNNRLLIAPEGPAMSALPFNTLPPEIWLGIFRYLDIPNILRTRSRVRDTHCIVWVQERVLYRYLDTWIKLAVAGTYGPRPIAMPTLPVLLARTSHSLERVLVRRETRDTGSAIGVGLDFGRFLLMASRDEARCYDLNLDASDNNPGARIIYRSSGKTLAWFGCVSAIGVEGRSIRTLHGCCFSLDLFVECGPEF